MPHIVALLLAYMKGNVNLCMTLVKAGASLGIVNNQGVSIFNFQVATRQLLFRSAPGLKLQSYCPNSLHQG